MYQPSEQLVCPFFCIVLELAASITTNNRQTQTIVNANSTRFLLNTPTDFKPAHFPKPNFINALLVLNRIRAPGTGGCANNKRRASELLAHESQNASPVITPLLCNTTSFPPLHGNAAWSSVPGRAAFTS